MKLGWCSLALDLKRLDTSCYKRGEWTSVQLAELVLRINFMPLLLSSTIIGLSISNNGSSRWLNPITRLSMQTGLIWPDFCSALIVERLAPLGLHNTRFRSVPVSCSPRTGADASSSTTRPTGTSPIPGPSNPGRACVARRARSCTRRRRSRPWRCRTSRRPCRSREACRIPRPWWCTRG